MFSWDVVVTAIATLGAASTGAYVQSRLIKSHEAAKSRMALQVECLSDVLSESSSAYMALKRIYDRKADFPVSWDEWRSTVARSSLLLEAGLFQRVLKVDRELYLLNLAVKYSSHAPDERIWLELCTAWRESRFLLVAAARESVGIDGGVEALGGRPSEFDMVWTPDFWRQRYHSLHEKVTQAEYEPPYI